MSLETNLALVSVALVDEPVCAADYCIVSALTWCTYCKVNVRHEYDVTVADGVDHICHSAAEGWEIVIICLLSMCLIELHEDRIFLCAVIIFREIEQTTVLLAFIVSPFHEFAGAPKVFLLLRVSVCKLLCIGEFSCTNPEVWVGLNILACPYAVLLIVRECLYLEGILTVNETLYVALHVEKADRLAHILMVNTEHVDLFVWLEDFLVNVTEEFAVSNLILSTHALCQARGLFFSVESYLPPVEAIHDKDVLAVFCPSSDAISRSRSWLVP